MIGIHLDYFSIWYKLGTNFSKSVVISKVSKGVIIEWE